VEHVLGVVSSMCLHRSCRPEAGTDLVLFQCCLGFGSTSDGSIAPREFSPLHEQIGFENAMRRLVDGRSLSWRGGYGSTPAGS
jgi:hypothetical protein